MPLLPRGFALLVAVGFAACVQDWSRPWHDAGTDTGRDLPGEASPPPSPWVAIPCGRYLMGSPSSEACRATPESLHEVLLTRRFEMMRTEVGRGELHGLLGHQPSSPGCEAESCPANNISWHLAAAYCNALSAKAGLPACYDCSGDPLRCQRRAELAGAAIHGCQGYRLPSDAEWEWAYRAGTGTALYSGPLDVCTGTSTAADGIAWYAANSSNRLHPRASRLPNAWGLYDLAGNALEWTHDGRTAGLDAVDPVGPDLGDATRVLRGGSFRDPPGALRGAAYRLAPPALSSDEAGFRCVRTLPVAQQALLSRIALPTKPGQYALDLDGQGAKNNLGNVIVIAQQVGIDLLIDELFAKGKILLLYELGGSSIEEQDSATLQSFGGNDTDQDPTNNFTGSAALAIDRETPTAGVLEGPLHGGRLQATGPMLLPLPIVVRDDPIPLVLLPNAKVDLTFSATGATGQIGGVVTASNLEGKLWPMIAGSFNWMLDPANRGVDAATRKRIRDTLDANHDGVITVAELKDSIIGRALTPDIDTDGDGKPDGYSIGVGVTLTTCTIAR